MNDTPHTPIPWACDYEDQEHTGIGIADDEMLIALVAPRGGPDELDQANAEFICLACNYHDELVAALAGCQDLIENWMAGPIMKAAGVVWKDEKHHPPALIAARALLAKVKDKP